MQTGSQGSVTVQLNIEAGIGTILSGCWCQNIHQPLCDLHALQCVEFHEYGIFIFKSASSSRVQKTQADQQCKEYKVNTQCPSQNAQLVKPDIYGLKDKSIQRLLQRFQTLNF